MDNQNSSSVRTATGRREGVLIALGSSLTIMGSVMVAPMLPKMGMEFGPPTLRRRCYYHWQLPVLHWRSRCAPP